MTSYFKMAAEFYEGKPQLLEGMNGMSPEELSSVLARDIAKICVKQYGATARYGVTEELPDDVAEAVKSKDITQAFYADTRTIRMNILNAEVAKLISGDAKYQHLLPTGVKAQDLMDSSNILVKGRYDRAAAQKMSESLPTKIEEFLTELVAQAARIASDPNWKSRSRQGLPSNFADHVQAARLRDKDSIAHANSGLEQAVRYGAVGVDLGAYALSTDTEAKRSLVHWENGDTLALHYPPIEGETMMEADERAALVASRINYPFGLMTTELRNAMISAVFLTHCSTSNADVLALAKEVRRIAGADEWADPTAVAKATNHAVMNKINNMTEENSQKAADLPQGFDFVRVAAASLLPNIEADETGWPAQVIQRLMQDLGTLEAASLVERSLPLNEPNISLGKPSWAGSRWESYGEYVARRLRVDAKAAMGGMPHSKGGQEDEDDFTPIDDLDFALYLPQNERLRDGAPLECLREFRNVLVNTETGKPTKWFALRSVIETNSFLKQRCSEQLGKKLKNAREIRALTAVELRGEAFLRSHSAGQMVNGFYTDLMPEQLTKKLHLENQQLAQNLASLTEGDDEILIDEIRGTQTARLEGNRHYSGIEAEELLPDDEVTWLTALASRTVTKWLQEYANAGNDESYLPSSSGSEYQLNFMDEVSLKGPVLREAAIRLQLLAAHSANQRRIEPTLYAQLRAYFGTTANSTDQQEDLIKAAHILGTCLILDAYTPSESTLTDQRSSTR